jgi:type VI secretion system protein ImpH
MLGGKIWDQSAGIVLELGPMPLEEAKLLFPESPETRHHDLVALLDFLVEGAVAIELRLRVTSASIGPSHLSLRSRLERNPRLGRSAWLTRHDPPREVAVRGRTYRPGRGREDPFSAAGTPAAEDVRIVMLPCSPMPAPT